MFSSNYLDKKNNDAISNALEKRSKNVKTVVVLVGECKELSFVKQEILSFDEGIKEIFSLDYETVHRKDSNFFVYETDNHSSLLFLPRMSKRHTNIIVVDFGQDELKYKLSKYLKSSEYEKLMRSISSMFCYKNSIFFKRPIAWIFFGTGNNGKTTVRNMIQDSFPEIQRVGKDIDISRLINYRYFIFETNQREEVDEFYGKLVYKFFMRPEDVYIINFEKTFNN